MGIKGRPGGAGLSLVVHHGTAAGLSLVRATGPVSPLMEAMRQDADVGVYETAARHLLRHRRTWPVGDLSPGVSSVFLTHARRGLSARDYHRYWELEHGPKALRHHLGMWDYTQISVTRTEKGEPLDGVAVVQWPRQEELVDRFTDGPIGTDVIRHDAAQFTDLDRLSRNLMTERIVIDHPPVTHGTTTLADARHLEVEASAQRLWERVGDFGGLMDWWPSGLASCESDSQVGVGMTRTLTWDNGSQVVERVTRYRPDERMLQLSIDDGRPPGIPSCTCRYEVRHVDSAHSRLDWYPRACVDAAAADRFAALVDGLWRQISRGLIKW